MAARELSIWEAKPTKPALDSYQGNMHQIRRPGVRAIQIYGVQFSVNPEFVMLAGAAYSIEMPVYTKSRDKKDSSLILIKHRVVTWALAGVIGGSPTQVDLSFSWNAPPGLIYADEWLEVGLRTDGFGVGDIEYEYRVFYKPVTISDVQQLQLTQM